MFLILALLTLTSPVTGMTQLLAAEGANVTLQWDSPGIVEPSTLILYCFRTTSPQRTMLEVVEGQQWPGPGGQYSGRVQWDREALRLGHVRVLLTGVSAQDEGRYWCYMYGNFLPEDGHWTDKRNEYFMLTVTRDKQDSEAEPQEVKDGFLAHVQSDLSLVQKLILYPMFVLMILLALCIALTWGLCLPLIRSCHCQSHNVLPV